MKKHLITFGLACLVLVHTVLACPFCKEAIPNQDAGTDLPEGFNVSIYAMLVGLFLVMGIGGWKLIQVVRQTDVAKEPRHLSPDFVPDETA